MTLEVNKIYNMDALAGMRQIATDSIDAIVADPNFTGAIASYPKPSRRIFSRRCSVCAIRVIKSTAIMLPSGDIRFEHRCTNKKCRNFGKAI